MTIFLNSPEECGDKSSAGLTMRIDLACSKKTGQGKVFEELFAS
jgi:hypothetical protein